MRLRSFYLVNAENAAQVFAVGLDLGDEAITYRRSPVGGAPQFGRYASAEQALHAYTGRAKVALEWVDRDAAELLGRIVRSVAAGASK